MDKRDDGGPVDNGKEIPRAILYRARRVCRRRIASLIVKCMAESDMDFAKIATRVGRDPEQVRRAIHALVAGRSFSRSGELDMISDIFLAMRYEITFAAVPASSYAAADAMLAARSK